MSGYVRISSYIHRRRLPTPRLLWRSERASPSNPRSGEQLIVLGIILLIIGFIAKVAILWTIGIILLVVGLILVALGSMGRVVGGRRHWY